MAKIVKWYILLVFLTLFTSTTTDGSQRRNMLEGRYTPATIEQAHSPERMLCALMCGVGNGVCEISQMNSHLSLDSKSYIKLLAYPRYSRIHPPLSDSGINFSPNSIFLQYGGTEYYIYALRKIII